MLLDMKHFANLGLEDLRRGVGKRPIGAYNPTGKIVLMRDDNRQVNRPGSFADTGGDVQGEMAVIE